MSLTSDVAAIDIRSLGKLYVDPRTGSRFRALRDVNLRIAQGEFVSLIGPSGCGKTTLLKIVDGLLPFDEGELLVGGSPLLGPGPDRAVVFQDFALLPWLTVRENAGFGLTLRRESRKKRDEVADHYLEMVGLTRFADSYPEQLSGGMQQRVGLARALAVNPRTLLMDEPFGALDAQTRTLLQADLLSIWETSSKSVIFVTHAMDEAVFLSDRVVIMGTNPGQVTEVIDIDLPRPRSDATRRDPRFVELTNYVWDVLRTLIQRDAEQGEPAA